MNTNNTVKFIQAYRLMEKGSHTYARRIIERLSDQHQHGHLFASWKGRGNNFGEWFLNLDHATQGEIIRIFGIGLDDKSFDKYAKLMEEDPIRGLWADPPAITKYCHELLKFFYNHGINEEPAIGISLLNIPTADNCYGNSANWGEYILSLNPTQQQFVIEQITSFILQQTQ